MSFIDDALKQYDKRPVFFTVLILFIAGFINGFYLAEIHKINIYAVWAYDIIQFVVLPFGLFYLLYSRFDISIIDYGIIVPSRSNEREQLLITTILVTSVLMLLYYGSGEILSNFIAPLDQEGYLKMVPDNGFKYLVVLYLALTAGIVEEITYRGLPLLLFSEYQQTKHFQKIYIIGTTFLFAIVHWENGLLDLLAGSVFGLYAAVLYLHYRNLIPLIIAHVVIDIAAFS